MPSSSKGHPTVAVDRVSRTYQVPSLERVTDLGLGARALARFGWRPMVRLQALRKVSFTAHSGESIGVIGINGSGKSTLLRLIAGLDVPTRGTVKASSQPVLLGVNAALQPELSGLSNARLGLLAMGFPPDVLEDTIAQVVSQANLGPAIHRPMKTYSAGMGSRLRFAIAAASQPEILLIDEALATGDEASRNRAEERMDQIREQAGTVFLVTHSGQTVEQTCTRAIWLHNGELVQDGPAKETATMYRWWAWNVAQGKHDVADKILRQESAKGSAMAEALARATGEDKEAGAGGQQGRAPESASPVQKPSGAQRPGQRKGGHGTPAQRQKPAGAQKAGQAKAGQGKAGQGKAGQGKAGQGKAGQGKAGQGKAGQGKAGQGKARQGTAGQGKARQGSQRRKPGTSQVPDKAQTKPGQSSAGQTAPQRSSPRQERSPDHTPADRQAGRATPEQARQDRDERQD